MRALWRPMLAAKPDPEDLDSTLEKLTAGGRTWLGSPKLDGIRATVQGGKLYSRALKLIPNREAQALWGREELDGLDGEIIVGPPTALDCFNRSTSVVMSRDKSIECATFNVFDCGDDALEPFIIRHSNAGVAIDGACFGQTLRIVPHKQLKTLKALLQYEEAETSKGHEGIMLRDPAGAYKHGRSTLKEGGLIAVKRFVDAEAVVVDTYEQLENTNEKTVNELGRSKRSSHKAGKVGKGTLGGFTVAMSSVGFSGSVVSALVSAGPKQHGAFDIGTGVGLTDAVRLELWKKRKSLVGKIVKFRYQKVGTMEKPRIPIFLGFRSKEDV